MPPANPRHLTEPSPLPFLFPIVPPNSCRRRTVPIPRRLSRPLLQQLLLPFVEMLVLPLVDALQPVSKRAEAGSEGRVRPEVLALEERAHLETELPPAHGDALRIRG